MADSTPSSYVSDVTTASFESQVLLASQQHPVLIDFWAPWCGPCRSLTPVLEKLVNEYAGALTLAKINADDEQMLAAQFGVRSLPTVALLYQGQILDHFVGAQPEGEVRAMLERHLGPANAAEPEPEPTELVDPLAPQASVEALREQLAAQPDQPELQAQLAGALALSGELDEAAAVLDQLPDDARNGDAGRAAAARLEFASTALAAAPEAELAAQIEADPDDLRARYQLAARQLLNGVYQPALDQLLEIMRRNRQFDDDLGRRGLVAAFTIIDDPALAARYRSRMTSLLF